MAVTGTSLDQFPGCGEDAALSSKADPPLVVDLDGTLLKSDLLIESFFATLAAKPLSVGRALFALRSGRAALKAELADGAAIDLARLPWNDDVIALLEREREAGRRIYLASASDRRLVDAVAAHFGFFDGVFASDGVVNLKSSAKAEALCRAFGTAGFDYLGNEAADFPVWQTARRVLVTNASAKIIASVRQRWPDAVSVGVRTIRGNDIVRALRLHQWLKNVLLAVPMLVAHIFTGAAFGIVALAFLSFSLCASSVYVLNDLIDLGRDRAHPTKRDRPFARGAIPITLGVILAPALLAASLLLACFVRFEFVGVLIAYYVLTLGYSLYLKRQMMLDVVALACLYGIRLVAGGVALRIDLSAWLAAFSLFLFCSLALVKRCTELIDRAAKNSDDSFGRAYRASDLPMLEALTAASGLTAVMVLALYINSDAVLALYTRPHGLWAICVILIYWIGRVLILMHRGEMPDDPVVFAASDRISQICVAAGALVVLASL